MEGQECAGGDGKNAAPEDLGWVSIQEAKPLQGSVNVRHRTAFRTVWPPLRESSVVL